MQLMNLISPISSGGLYITKTSLILILRRLLAHPPSLTSQNFVQRSVYIHLLLPPSMHQVTFQGLVECAVSGYMLSMSGGRVLVDMIVSSSIQIPLWMGCLALILLVYDFFFHSNMKA